MFAQLLNAKERLTWTFFTSGHRENSSENGGLMDALFNELLQGMMNLSFREHIP